MLRSFLPESFLGGCSFGATKFVVSPVEDVTYQLFRNGQLEILFLFLDNNE
jgi:hypothetical protein